jgi:hypothetical protein
LILSKYEQMIIGKTIVGILTQSQHYENISSHKTPHYSFKDIEQDIYNCSCLLTTYYNMIYSSESNGNSSRHGKFIKWVGH